MSKNHYPFTISRFCVNKKSEFLSHLTAIECGLSTRVCPQNYAIVPSGFFATVCLGQIFPIPHLCSPSKSVAGRSVLSCENFALDRIESGIQARVLPVTYARATC